MLTLGFTNQFYTLWNVVTTTEYTAGMVLNGQFTGGSYTKVKPNFIQNLSRDYNQALLKIKKYANDRNKYWVEDLGLKGEVVFIPMGNQPFIQPTYEIHQFTVGKFTGCDIRTCEDIWQLDRAMKNEKSVRTRVLARRRLIELGHLVKHFWIEEEQFWNQYDALMIKNIKHNYATKDKIQELKKEQESKECNGHHFNNNEKIQIKIKLINKYSFESKFGTTFVREYITPDNKAFKYMGGNPIEISDIDFVEIRATTKHDNYIGQPQTKLLRITPVKI